MMHQLKFGSRKIEFTLRSLNRKSISIRVHPDGKVEVLSPVSAKEHDVLEKVRQKSPWILRQIDYFESFKPLLKKRRFINGETHLYLGRQYRLKIISDDLNRVKAYRGQLCIQTVDTDPEALKVQLDTWYKQRAITVFNDLLKEVLPKFNRYKLKDPPISVRLMSKRWGSCTPSGKIILNTELIKAPKSSIEYVIVHELCHLIHYNHGKSFQNLLTRIIPDWKKRKERLELSLY